MRIFLLHLFCLTFLLSSCSGPSKKAYPERAPSSHAQDRECYFLLKNLIREKPFVKKGWLRFDFAKYNFYQKRYQESLSNPDSLAREIDGSAESLLAFLEASGGVKKPLLDSPGLLKRRKLYKKAQWLVKQKNLGKNDLEKFASEVYLLTHGEAARLRDLMNSNSRVRSIVARVVQEKMMAKGLERVLKSQFNSSKSRGRLSRFIDSPLGEKLISAFMSLPVLFGLPPMYLPGLKKIKVPPKLLKRAIKDGLTDELLLSFERGINLQLKKEGAWDLSRRSHYEIFRRYYMNSISIFYFYYVAHSIMYDVEATNEEKEELEKTVIDAQGQVDELLDLESKGYDLFGDQSGIVNACLGVESCLQDMAPDKDSFSKGDRLFDSCQKFFDPELRCNEEITISQ